MGKSGSEVDVSFADLAGLLDRSFELDYFNRLVSFEMLGRFDFFDKLFTHDAGMSFSADFLAVSLADLLVADVFVTGAFLAVDFVAEDFVAGVFFAGVF